MDATRFEIIEEMFSAALEIPREEREAFVRKLSQGDQAIENEVLSLLAANELDDNLLIAPINQLFGDFSDDEPAPRLPEIDRYRVIREIGEGGMAIVYLAEQIGDDFTRQAAVKVLRGTAGAKRFLRRFLRERQILAGLSHPNIATLYGGGRTKTGEPYIAMEFINGLPVTEYCAGRKLELPARLRLFLEICRAVDYAHRRLVIHRDLKPSNILVTEGGTPKLLDFGIAKVVTDEHQGGLTQTQPGERYLTPAYASPEQVLGETVTTATDIYALGLILHQMATGRLPYELKLGTISEALREICETEVRPPSTLPVDSLVVEGFGISMTPKRLVSEIKGDLDIIVCKALQKDPARRYASVEQFAEDISRLLQGLPILARTDSFRYRTTKFVRRNRVQVAAAGLVIVSLLGGSGIAIWQGNRAQRERELASVIQARYKRQSEDTKAFIKAQFEIYDDIKDKAGSTETRAKIVTNTADFLKKSEEDAANDPSLAVVLAEGYSRLGEILGKPKQGQIGDLSGALLNFEKARIFYAIAFDRKFQVTKTGEGLAATHEALGMILSRLDRIEEAKSNFQEGLKRCSQANLPNTSLQTISLKKRLADLQVSTGDVSLCLEQLRQLNEIILQLDPNVPRHRELITSTRARPVLPYRLTWELLDARLGPTDFTRSLKLTALELQKQHLSLCRELANGTPENGRYRPFLVSAEGRLGNIQLAAGFEKEALATGREALRHAEELAGEDLANQENQWLLATTEIFTAEEYAETGQLREGLIILARSAKRFEMLTKNNPLNLELRADAARMHFLTGAILSRLGDSSREISAYQEAITLLESFPAESTVLNTYGNLSGVYSNLARKAALPNAPPGIPDCLRRIIEIQKRQADRPNATPLQIDCLAWTLLTCPLADQRNPKTALELRSRARSKESALEPHAFCIDALNRAQAGAEKETERLAANFLNLFGEIKMENRETAAMEMARKFTNNPL